MFEIHEKILPSGGFELIAVVKCKSVAERLEARGFMENGA